MTGAEQIAQERKEQIEKHGRSIEQDVSFNTDFQLLHGAGLLLHEDGDEWEATLDLLYAMKKLNGWDRPTIEHMCNKPYKERLVIAGALLAAEIDRLQHNQNEG